MPPLIRIAGNMVLCCMTFSCVLGWLAHRQGLRITTSQAEARFAALALGELLAFAAFIWPIWGGFWIPGWKRDCLIIGGVTAATVFFFTVCVLSVPKLFSGKVRSDRRFATVIESAIFLIYALNTCGLAVAITRTGGPAVSLFAPLIPAQLSAILILEVQREMADGRLLPWVYGYLFIAILGTVDLQNWGKVLWQLSAVTSQGNDNFDFNNWVVLFSIIGMLISFLGYWLPRQSIWMSFTKLFSSQSNGAN